MENRWSAYEGQLLEGRYRLKTFLGTNGKTGVFETENRGQPAVVQILDRAAAEAPAQLESWRIASQLHSPELIQVFAVGDTNFNGERFVYAVMESPDDALKDTLANRPLEPKEVHQVLQSMLAGTAHLHAKRLAHGRIRSDSIVAIGDNVKLMPDHIRPATVSLIDDDLRGVGTTVIELLTQERVSDDDAGVSAKTRALPSPFREIARSTLEKDPEKRWTAAAALQYLQNPHPKSTGIQSAPPTSQPEKSWRAFGVLGAIVAAAAILAFFVFRTRDDGPRHAESVASNPPAVSAVEPQPKPSPIQPTAPSSKPATPVSKPSVEEPKPFQTKPGWAVITAAYRRYKDARARATRVNDRWPEFRPDVYPPEGSGRRYFVVIGTGLSKQQAEQLHRRARAAGFPNDTYVTRLH